MSRATEVPITPSVLTWAISESGYTREEIANAIDVPVEILKQWEGNAARPTLTQTRRLAAKLHRPFAAFLLPNPPARPPVAVQFRHPIDYQRDDLNPKERIHLRRAARLQEVLSWIAKEIGTSLPQTPSASLRDDPISVANRARQVLKIPTSRQITWPSSSAAFDEWRAALESAGHIVFLFSIGSESCRGFSIWNDQAPVIAVNTAWNEEARIYTLFHELGHLITRTSSACVESVRRAARTDPVERWCERFAADFLMPSTDVDAMLRQAGWQRGAQVSHLRVASAIARRFKVSLRASVIRLIELGAATWALYDQIPPVSDTKQRGGGGGGRIRSQIREDQFGDRTTALLVTAVDKEILSRWQAVEYLDIPDTAFDDLAHAVHRSRRA